MNYLSKRFTVGGYSKAYSAGFDAIFRKNDSVPSCTGFKTPNPKPNIDYSIGDNLGVPHTDACKKAGIIHLGECPV